jgi:hypothetical protein
MAKASPQAYRVVGNALAYNGKFAKPDEVVTDIPGQSISWLLEGGHIVPATQPKAEVEAEVEPEPEVESAPTEAEEV